MASDFAIAQFRYLERLLLVHGHWCYRRIAMMVTHLNKLNLFLNLCFFISDCIFSKFRYVTSSTRTSRSDSRCFGMKLMLLSLVNQLITIGTCLATTFSSLRFLSSLLESLIKMSLLAFVSR